MLQTILKTMFTIFKSVYPYSMHERGYVPYVWYSGNKGSARMHFFMELFNSSSDELDMELQTAY
jgi:hypothetical protein